MNKNICLFSFMNAYSYGKSGGDIVFVETFKRIKRYKKIVITSLLGKNLCQTSGLEGEYLITTSENKFSNVILTYIKRTFKAFSLRLKVKEEDILLGTSDFFPDVLPISYIKIRNKKTKWVQYIFHLIPSSRKIVFITQRISFLFIKKLADLIIVDNNLLKGDLVKLGFNKNKIEVNYPGIDLDYFKSIKSEEMKGYDGIFMAQLRPAKGIFDLIEIWRLICIKNPKAKLGIIGKGEDEVMNKVKSKIENDGLKKNISILGFLDDKEAFSKIKASKIFIFPSHEEGFGIAPLEAQALGLPVIAWNLPVFNEIFSKGMIKIEINEIKKFVEGIIDLLSNEKFYLKLSEEAIENANHYDWRKTSERTERLIK